MSTIANPFIGENIEIVNQSIWMPHLLDVNWQAHNCGFLNASKFSSPNPYDTLLQLKEEHRNIIKDDVLSRKIRFYPTKEQKCILRRAEQAYRWTYNVTSYIMDNKIQPFITPSAHKEHIKNMLKYYEQKGLTDKQREKLSTQLQKKLSSLQQQEILHRTLIDTQRALPKKNITKKIDAKLKAISKLQMDINKIQQQLAGTFSEPIQVKEDYSKDKLSIRNLIVTMKNNPLFSDDTLPEDCIPFVKEKNQWFKERPEMKAMLKECHKDIRSQAVADAIANYNTQLTNIRLGHQTEMSSPFKRYKKLKSTGFMVPISKKCLYISSQANGTQTLGLFKNCFEGKFGLLNFARNHCKHMRWFKAMFPHKETYKDFKITFNVMTNKYYLILPYANIQSNNGAELQTGVIAAIDIGSKPRQAVLFTNGDAMMFGTKDKQGKHDITRLCELQAKIRRLKSKIDKGKLNSKSKRNKKKKIRKLAQKIQNILHDADYKTIKEILDKADIVLIPKFDSSTRKKKGGFNKKVRVDSSLYAHSRFVERLKSKAKNRDKIVIQVIEPYTSKTCTRCLSLKNDLGSAKVFRCTHCSFEGDRDLCGARNILMLNRGLFLVNSNVNQEETMQGSSSQEIEIPMSIGI